MMPRPAAPPQQQPQQTIASYKAFTLEPGNMYEVYVSYITEGPCNFSIQLKQSEEVLAKLMREINCMNLTPIDGVPIPGTVCLARCLEDGHICRAVVTNEVDGQFKVFYVDFGNYEVVSLDVLYEIPFKFVIPKVMAIRFALEGVEKSTVTLEMQCAFKEFVDNRLLRLKVMPVTCRTALPRCELWDAESRINALDLVKQAAAAAYPAAIALTRGFCQLVKASYVFSCSRFFVQLLSKADELANLMREIQVVCQHSGGLSPESLKVGLPCLALFELDCQWYRSQIVEVLNPAQVRVQYVDYGNEEVVNTNMLKPIEGKQLMTLRPQAIECCLNGYQKMGVDTERDTLLEQLILEQDFTMKVVEMQDKKALVELINESNYNVASLLLDKIAATRSQLSPLLVQMGNKIEHRKSVVYGSPKEQAAFNVNGASGRDQRKPERSSNFNGGEGADSESWRQSNKDFRNKRDDLNQPNERESRGFNRNEQSRNNFDQRNGEGNSSRNNRPSSFKVQDRLSRDRDDKNNEWADGRSTEDRKSFSPRGKTSTSDGWNGDSSPKGGGGSSWGENKEQKDNWNQTRAQDNTRKFAKPRDKTWEDNGRKSDEPSSEWGGDSSDRRGGDRFKKFNDRKPANNDEWGGSSENTHQKRGNRSDNWNGSNSNTSKPGGGFHKKPDFKREGSGLSSSGSERSFKKNFSKDRGGKFDNKSKSSWNAPKSSEVEVPNPALDSDSYSPMKLDQTESTVTISWFYNPTNFYVILQDKQDEFKQLMGDIQQFYTDKKKSSCAAVGAPVIGLFPEDKVLYRAKILEVLGSQYKVLYVDFGNTSVIDKIWPIEKRFMDLPAQAVTCKLYGIETPAAGWPEATQFGPYFDKPQFLCQFISQEGGMFNVRLLSGSEDIGEQLKAAGLVAASVPPLAPQVIEPALLIGQQFKAMLLSVNGLGDFSICLQSGATFVCSVFNLENSTETHETNLTEKIGQILIFYVDNVVEDKLQVTPYDSTGAKIKLIDKDEEAYEYVDLLCPYLITNLKLSGLVVHSENQTVFIQPADCAQFVESLLNGMFEHYDSTVLDSPITPVENFVYAAKSSDGNWYRAKVTSIAESNCVINFVDYGNSETVEVTALRDLTVDFLDYAPILSVPVTLTASAEALVGAFISVTLEFSESGLLGTIDGDSTAPEIIPTTTPTVIPAEEPVITDTKPGTLVVVSHMDSPSDFYLHFCESTTAIEELQLSLQEQAADMPDLENPTVGVLCAAPYSVDHMWYRAQVLDADADITTVRFVDYGNTDVLDNKTTRAKTLPPNLLALEVYATRCRLKIKPVDEEWSVGALERFEQLTSTEDLRVELLAQDEKTNYVELYSGNVNVREILIAENLAAADEDIASEHKTHGFVSHLNSPSEFWIQLENCVDELESVAERLSGAENFKELEDLAPGTLCAALFPDDQMWYRARILSNTIAGIEVLFVDYGNSCTSCSLRELPEELVMVQALAQKCSLLKPDGLNAWGPEMARIFTEIAADGQTTFEVKKLTTGETTSVELFLEGVNIITKLLPVTEDVQVQDFNNLEELVLSKNGQQVDGKFKLEPLPDSMWNEDTTSILNNLNIEQPVFQAEFLPENTIRLYTKGCNDIRLELKLKSITPQSSPLKIRTEIHSPSFTVSSEETGREIVNNVVEKSMDIVSDRVVVPIMEELLQNSTGHPLILETSKKDDSDYDTTEEEMKSPERKTPDDGIEEIFQSPMKESDSDSIQEEFESPRYSSDSDKDSPKINEACDKSAKQDTDCAETVVEEVMEELLQEVHKKNETEELIKEKEIEKSETVAGSGDAVDTVMAIAEKHDTEKASF